MGSRVLFGDPARSPIWAVVMGGERSTASVELLPETLSIIVVTEGSISWGNQDICELSATALLTGNQRVLVEMENGEDVIVVAFSREVFESLVHPFANDLIPDLSAVLTDGGEEPKSCALMAPFILFSRIVPELQEVPNSVASGSFWFEGQIRLLLSQTCFRQGGLVEQAGGLQQLGKSLKRINQVKRILRDRPGDALDLSDLAQEVGCSCSYLSRTFSLLTGMTVRQYLRRARIHLAASLFENGEESVSKVASQVGYHSLSHFTKAFQKEMGCSPSRFLTSS